MTVLIPLPKVILYGKRYTDAQILDLSRAESIKEIITNVLTALYESLGFSIFLSFLAIFFYLYAYKPDHAGMDGRVLLLHSIQSLKVLYSLDNCSFFHLILHLFYLVHCDSKENIFEF